MIAKGSKVVRVPESLVEARRLIGDLISNRPSTLLVQHELFAKKDFASLSVVDTIDVRLDPLKKVHEAELDAERERVEALRKLHEVQKQMELEVVAAEALAARRKWHEELRATCAKHRPRGRCDQCGAKVKRWKVIYRKYSCLRPVSMIADDV